LAFRWQIAEHAIIKQVAEKLFLHRFNSNGNEGITLELEPKELGALKIAISVHKGLVSADILTPHSAVRDMLDKNQSLLRDAMAGMGLTVDHFSVTVGDFSQLPHHFSGQGPFNNEFGTKFAFTEGSEQSADSAFAMAESEFLWGYKESGISVYV
jgi:flagellar hook-length control protein FliK